MSKTTDQARKSIAAAEAQVLKWREVQAEALDALSAAQTTVPEEPSDLDRIAKTIAESKSRANLADAAARRAGDKLEDARRALLYALADDEADEVHTARKAYSAHRAKIQSLLNQARALEGNDRLELRFPNVDVPRGSHVVIDHGPTKSRALHEELGRHVIAEAVLRYVADNDRLPDRLRDLVGATPSLHDDSAVRSFFGGLRGTYEPFGEKDRALCPPEAVEFAALRNPAAPVVEYDPEDEPHQNFLHETPHYVGGTDVVAEGHYHGDGCEQRLVVDRQNLANGYAHLVPADSPARRVSITKDNSDGASEANKRLASSSGVVIEVTSGYGQD